MTEIKPNTVFSAIHEIARSNKAPILDIWSNEGGGREIFERDKALREARIAGYRSELPAEKERLGRFASEAQETYDKLKAAFIEKYGSERLANLELTLKSRNDGDSVSISPEARQLFRDAQQLDQQGKRAVDLAQLASTMVKDIESKIDGAEKLNILANTSYEMRFNKEPQARLQAARDLDQLWNGPQNYGNVQTQTVTSVSVSVSVSVEQTTISASAGSISEERKLFKLDLQSSIVLDRKALENLTPDQQAVEQLKKLVEYMRKQGGFDELRAALGQALTDRSADLAAGVGAR